jgi:CsoR family transcriptional regulator, copper-sensing transcriptional repressor
MSHTPRNLEADRRALQVRMNKITGQLRGVQKMIDGDYDCAEVLNQLVSARKALKSLAEKLISDHLEHCLAGSIREEERRRRLREATTMLKRYVD